MYFFKVQYEKITYSDSMVSFFGCGTREKGYKHINPVTIKPRKQTKEVTLLYSCVFLVKNLLKSERISR